MKSYPLDVPEPKDGGPAFPIYHQPSPEFSFMVAETGMSLRDYFAAGPIGEEELSMLRDAYFSEFPEEKLVNVATLRYFHADRMLKARNQPPS